MIIDELKNIMEFAVVECVTGGKGFINGHLYPLMGWNNGVYVIRETKNGDVIADCFQTGGKGKGLFNSWDNDGVPSFSPVIEL